LSLQLLPEFFSVGEYYAGEIPLILLSSERTLTGHANSLKDFFDILKHPTEKNTPGSKHLLSMWMVIHIWFLL
jgi:hypothetical protein